MKVSIFYLGGNYGTIDTTLQSLQDGTLLDDGYLRADDLENEGVILTRARYTSDAEGRQAIPHGDIAIISPEELANIGYIAVDGQPFLKRVGPALQFRRCIIDALEEIGIGSSAADDESAIGQDEEIEKKEEPMD